MGQPHRTTDGTNSPFLPDLSADCPVYRFMSQETADGPPHRGSAMKLLHIDSSILGTQSASRELSAAWTADWQARHPESSVSYRDLAAQSLPHLTGDVLMARSAPHAVEDADLRIRVEADEAMMQEFLAADVVVIGAPMYNFSVPSQLKAWIDRIAVAGRTFRYGPSGPEGLAGGKKVVVISSRGGVYSAGPAAGLDHQESYLC